MKSHYSIIKSPMVTEKLAQLVPNRQYAFWVDKGANKVQIKRAVETLYSVKVKRVASMIVKGKVKRIRWNQPGKTSAWKKAIVTLEKGFEIKNT